MVKNVVGKILLFFGQSCLAHLFVGPFPHSWMALSARLTSGENSPRPPKTPPKKRHRRRLPPSFVSTPLTLSNLTHFFTPTEQDRRRAFVRLGFLWGGNQNIVQSQPSLQITPRRLDQRLAERERGIHAHIALVGAPWSGIRERELF